MDPPNNLLCPITLSLFKDPVFTADGHSYERTAIEQHFRKNCTSPATNLRLPHKKLVPNFRLRALCIEWKEQQARKNNDIDVLWYKCLEPNKSVKIIIDIISQMIELVTQSDVCILHPSRLNTLKECFIKINPENFTNDVESAFETLLMNCKEKYGKCIQDIYKTKQMRKVTEESIVVYKVKIEEEEKLKTVEKAEVVLKAARRRLAQAKENMEEIESVTRDAESKYKEAVEARKEKTDRLNGLNELVKAFREEETRQTSILELFEDFDDENLQTAVTGGSGCGKKRKVTFSSSSSSGKRQKMENKGAQNLFELGDEKYNSSTRNSKDAETGKRMVESAAIANFAMAIAVCSYHSWNAFKKDYKKAFKMFMDMSDYSYAQSYIGDCYY
eukprot:g4378.t1